MKKIDCLKFTRTSRGRGRPKNTWIEPVQNDPKAELIDNIALKQT